MLELFDQLTIEVKRLVSLSFSTTPCEFHSLLSFRMLANLLQVKLVDLSQMFDQVDMMRKDIIISSCTTTLRESVAGSDKRRF